MSPPAIAPALRAGVEVRLAPDQRADAATTAVLRRLLTVIGDNLPGTLADADDEHLHQLRIAVRRTRTVQRQMAGVFGPGELPGFRSEFRWLQSATGAARDLDVHLSDLGELRELLPSRMRGDLDPLIPVLRHARMTAHADMRRALTSTRLDHLFADWERLLETLVERPLEDRPQAAQPIGEVAGAAIRRVYKRILHMGAAIGRSSSAGEYHELRKKGKELRYLMELFGSRLWPPDRVAPMVKSLKGLQDVLGRHQDREIQAAMLISVADEVAGLRGGGAACVAMGVLVDRLRVEERHARAEFGKRFAALAARPQRALVKQTFR